jgi:ELWxxDGT repeat protein
MKYFYLLFLFFVSVHTNAQNPLIVKTVSSTVTEPEYKDQKYWQNNEWNGLFFYQGKGTPSKLCITDGTSAGTKYVADIGNGQLITTIPAQDFMYLITYNTISISPAITETQLWKSDGTAAGTVLIYTFPQITGSTVGHNWTSNRRNQNFSLIGNTMIFSAYDATNGVEVWKTDGTPAGTALLKDIKTGTGSSTPWGYCKIGTEVFFSAMQTGFERKLWKTDGTTAGTEQVAVPEPFYIVDYAIGVLNNKMLFYAHNTVDGYEPYISDGTPAGTYLLKNVNPTAASSGNSSLAAVQCTEWHFNNKYAYFIAFNGTANALWRTDGTNAGTIQLTADADNVSSANSNTTLTDIDANSLWMLHHSTTGNSKLYKSDGTAAGTYLVRQGLNLPANMKLYNNSCWFSGRPSGSFANVEVWRSGGNVATTNMAFDIAPGFPAGAPTLLYSSNPYGFFIKNNKLYFFASTTVPSAHHLYQYTGDFTFNGGLVGGRWRDSANWNSMMPPGITDTVFINSGTPNALNINGSTAYAGVLNIANNTTINFTNSTDSLIVNTKLNNGTSSNFIGNGVLAFRNITNDTVKVENGFTANNVAVQSNTNLLNGQGIINNNINLTSGKLFLNNNNLLLTGNTSSATATSSAYIATNGTGSLQIQNIGTGARVAAVSFPIGTSTAYLPVTFTNSGDADNFTARVINTASQNYIGETPSGQQYVTGAVNNTWFINEATNGGSDATIGLQWNATQELNLFDRTQSYLGHYTGGVWNLGLQGLATGSNPYSFSRSNITSFSPFGIFNNNAVLPLKFVSFTAQKCNTNQVCLTWKTANEQNVSHFEIERSVDGFSFSEVGTKTANNLLQNTYTAIDDISTIQAKQLYYRIKQVDINRKTSNSTVQLIKLQSGDEIAIYPNPVNNEINIVNWNKVQQVQLIDVTGKTIKQWQAITSLALNVPDITTGIYFIKMKLINGEVITQKIIKQ